LVLSILTLIVLFLTYIWIKKYTKISDIQTTELIKQRLLISLPSLSTQLITVKTVNVANDQKSIEVHFRFKNIGNGIANNIIFRKVIFKDVEDTVLIDSENCLAGEEIRPNETKGVIVYFSSPDPAKIPNNSQDANQIIANETMIISIWFQDIAGNVFQQDNRISKLNYFQAPPIQRTLKEFQHYRDSLV
jgi:hypothetical protein